MTAFDLDYDARLDHVYDNSYLSDHGESDLTYGPDHEVEECDYIFTPLQTMAVACVVPVPWWLMDTGSGVDLVDRRDVKNSKEFITRGAGITRRMVMLTWTRRFNYALPA